MLILFAFRHVLLRGSEPSRLASDTALVLHSQGELVQRAVSEAFDAETLLLDAHNEPIPLPERPGLWVWEGNIAEDADDGDLFLDGASTTWRKPFAAELVSWDLAQPDAERPEGARC